MPKRSSFLYFFGILILLVFAVVTVLGYDIVTHANVVEKPRPDLPDGIPWNRVPWREFPEDFPWDAVPWERFPSDTDWETLPWTEIPWEKIPESSVDVIPWESVPWEELPEDFPYDSLPWEDVPWEELPETTPWKEVPWADVPWKDLPDDTPWSEVPWGQIPWKELPEDYPWAEVPWDDLEHYAWVEPPEHIHMFAADGYCTICKRVRLILRSGSAEAEYAGAPLSAEHFTVEAGFLLPGHTLTAHYASLPLVGSADNVFTVSITDAEGEDVGDRYVVELHFGMLTLSHRKLTITTGSAEKTYDGATLTAHSFEQNGLAAGDRIEISYTGAQTARGTSDNTATVRIFNAENVDVTQNYEIDLRFGTLSVN